MYLTRPKRKKLNKLRKRNSLQIKLWKIIISLAVIFLSVYLNIDDQGNKINAKSATVVVTDGDTLKIDDTRIRLYGIDAPEMKQTCNRDAISWQCGVESKILLQKLINGHQVNCTVKNKDRYKRHVAICYVGKLDLNREMVRQGMAVAYTQYSKKYLADENFAKENKIGIWSGNFTLPYEWRKNKKMQ